MNNVCIRSSKRWTIIYITLNGREGCLSVFYLFFSAGSRMNTLTISVPYFVSFDALVSDMEQWELVMTQINVF